METNFRVKTAQAAEIAGVGYEGFRSWLKRGLPKDTGILPKFYASDAPAEIADAKRWRWSSFGVADLYSFGLTKLMLESGLPWSMVCSVASDERLWRSHRSGSNVRYVAVFSRSDQYTLYTPDELTADLTSGTVKHDWMTLFDLHELRRNVVLRTRAVVLRTIAIDMAGTSKVFATKGPNMLSPDEAKKRQATIEILAQELQSLADIAEKGAGSYREFDAILGGLHAQGKFPDNAAVSAVAFAFADGSTL